MPRKKGFLHFTFCIRCGAVGSDVAQKNGDDDKNRDDEMYDDDESALFPLLE